MAKRIERVNSLLEQEVGKILLHDFSFSPDVLVTVTRADTSSNIIESKIYVSVFPEAKADAIINVLNKSVYDIQYKINRILRMRPIPKIKFVKETEVSKAARVEELLAKAGQEEVEKTKKIK